MRASVAASTGVLLLALVAGVPFVLYADDWTPSWTTSQLSQARESVAAAALGNKVYFGGGYNHWTGGNSNAVDIYDATSRTWSTAALSQARCFLAAAAAGNKVLFGGGSLQIGDYRDVVDVYDSSTNTWSTAALSQARDFLAATAVGNLVFFAGGRTSGGYSDVVDIFNSTSNTWSTAKLSQARGFLSATSAGSRVYFAGGHNASGYSSVVDIYDVSTNTWSTATLSQARDCLSAAAGSGQVFFGGGQPTDTVLSDVVDIHHTASNTWSTAALSQDRYYLSAVSGGNKVFFAGGYSNTGGYTKVVDIYNTAANSWSTATLSQGRYRIGSAAAANQVVFAGGYNSIDQYSNVVDIYTSQDYPAITSSKAWTLIDHTTVAGRMQLTAPGSLGLGNYNLNVGSMIGNAPIQLGNGTLTVGGDHTSTIYSGVISGPGGLTKTGTGTLTLTNTSTYNGPTTITGGTVRIGPRSAVPTGAVAAYTFADGATATDMSGNGNHGTLINSPHFVQGPGGTGTYAIALDGASQYVSAPFSNSFANLTSWTASAWINLNSSSPGANANCILGTRFNADILGYDIKIMSNNTLVHSDIASSTDWISTNADAGYSFTVGNWYMVTETVTSDEYKLYVNGSLIGSGPVGSTPLFMRANDRLGIGLGTPEVWYWHESFNGSLSNVYIYGRALNQGEVTGLYNSVVSPESTPVNPLPSNVLPSNASLVIGSNGILDLNGAKQQVMSISDSAPGSGGSIISSNSSSIAVLTVAPSGGSSTFSGSIRGGISLVISGNGVQVLAGSNTYTGETTIVAGTLAAGAANTLSPYSAMTINGGVLDLTAGSQTLASLTMTDNATLKLGIDGLTDDRMTVLGTLILGGSLDVELVNGFDPQAGQTFDLFSGNLSGTFSQVSLPALSDGLSWDTSNLYTTGTIGVVPEPSTFVLLGMGAVGLLGFAWRNRVTFTVVLLSAVVVTASCECAANTVLLQDDFDGTIVDASKWNVVTTGIQGGAAVVEGGGHVELINRGHLNTVQQFKPTDPAVGGLCISGVFQNVSPLNNFSILTRSDGVPAGEYAETQNGIQFLVFNFGKLEIVKDRNGVNTSLALSTHALANVGSASFRFEATDDGTNLTFTVAEIGNPSNSVLLSATDSTDFPTNLVTFHGRERVGSTNACYLDDVTISSLVNVPEPSTLVLLAAGGMCLLASWRRSRQLTRQEQRLHSSHRHSSYSVWLELAVSVAPHGDPWREDEASRFL